MAEPTSRIDSARVEPAAYGEPGHRSSAGNRDSKPRKRQRSPASHPDSQTLPEIEVSADTQEEYEDHTNQPAESSGHDNHEDEKHKLDTMA